MRQKAKIENYNAPAGGWGSLNAVVHILTQEEVALLGSEILLKQNKPGGFMCVSCSWAKPASFRGIEGSRYVVLMNPADMEADGLKSGDTVTLVTEANDGVERSLSELQVVPYDIPCRSIAGYYPECNVLVPLWHYAEGSKVPAAKSVPARLFKDVLPEIIEGGEMPIAAS